MIDTYWMINTVPLVLEEDCVCSFKRQPRTPSGLNLNTTLSFFCLHLVFSTAVPLQSRPEPSGGLATARSPPAMQEKKRGKGRGESREDRKIKLEAHKARPSG